MAYPSEKIKKDWIQNGISNEALEWVKSFGEFLGKKEKDSKMILSTSQLRRFFGELRRIDSDFKNKKSDVLMLKPMLAYAVGRDKNDRGMNKTRIKEFEEEISQGIGYIRLGDEEKGKSDFKNFLKLFEAIVAYHKYYGGK